MIRGWELILIFITTLVKGFRGFTGSELRDVRDDPKRSGVAEEFEV